MRQRVEVAQLRLARGSLGGSFDPREKKQLCLPGGSDFRSQLNQHRSPALLSSSSSSTSRPSSVHMPTPARNYQSNRILLPEHSRALDDQPLASTSISVRSMTSLPLGASSAAANGALYSSGSKAAGHRDLQQQLKAQISSLSNTRGSMSSTHC